MTFEELSKKAYDYLYKQQDICEKKYLLSKHERWYYDQEVGLIVFYTGEKIILRIKFEEVGSVSLISNTWLWSWDNNSILENIKTEIVRGKELGEKNGFEKLVNAKWEADMYDGWEMTAISAYLLKAKGAYRTPNDEENIFSFMLLKEIEVVDEMALEEMKRVQ